MYFFFFTQHRVFEHFVDREVKFCISTIPFKDSKFDKFSFKLNLWKIRIIKKFIKKKDICKNCQDGGTFAFLTHCFN